MKLPTALVCLLRADFEYLHGHLRPNVFVYLGRLQRNKRALVVIEAVTLLGVLQVFQIPKLLLRLCLQES